MVTTKVAAHLSHSRKGKTEHVKAHIMKLNPRVHKAHEKRLTKEIKALQEAQAKGIILLNFESLSEPQEEKIREDPRLHLRG